MEADTADFERVAKLLADVCPARPDSDAEKAGQLEVPISQPTALFLEGIALKHGIDPAVMAGFLLDSLTADENCMRHLLERRRR